MQGSITLNELGIFIVFVLVVLAGGYTVMILRRMNGLIQEASAMLQKSKDHFNRIIPNMDEISENTARISQEWTFPIKNCSAYSRMGNLNGWEVQKPSF
jgi:archaellum component FlaG (FlaF/FlaG flagellin family)